MCEIFVLKLSILHFGEFYSMICNLSASSHLDSSIHVMSLKVESGRFSFHFREVFEKCIDYIGKFLVHFREVLKFS